jgi:hypothetical protein
LALPVVAAGVVFAGAVGAGAIFVVLLVAGAGV